MILLSVCLRVLFTISILPFTECIYGSGLTKYGEPCESIGACQILSNLQCKNGACQCSIMSYKAYSIHAEVTCEYKNLITGFKKECDAPCPSGQFCEDGRCLCNNGTVKIGSDCYDAVVMSPMENCSVNEGARKAHICDYSKFSFCQYPKCICYSKYFYNSTTKACEKRSSSALYSAHSYKSRPNEYCAQESDCFEGLLCIKHKALCACPSHCKYVEKYGACDCGTIEFETSAGVFWIGTLLGLASVLFWIWAIRRTCRKGKEKLQESQELQSSYSLQPQPMPQPTPQYSAGESNVDIQPSKVTERTDDPPAYSSLGFAGKGVSSSQEIPQVNFPKMKTDFVGKTEPGDDLPYPVQPMMSHGAGAISNPSYSMHPDADLSKPSDPRNNTPYPVNQNAPDAKLEPYPLAPPCSPPDYGPDLNAKGPFFPPPSAPTFSEDSAPTSLPPSHSGPDYSPWKVGSDTQPLNPDDRKQT